MIGNARLSVFCDSGEGRDRRQPGKLRVQQQTGFVDRFHGRRNQVGNGLDPYFRFAQTQVAGVNPASARAEFAALLDVYVEQNLYDFHGVRPLQGETIH